MGKVVSEKVSFEKKKKKKKKSHYHDGSPDEGYCLHANPICSAAETQSYSSLVGAIISLRHKLDETLPVLQLTSVDETLPVLHFTNWAFACAHFRKCH